MFDMPRYIKHSKISIKRVVPPSEAGSSYYSPMYKGGSYKVKLELEGKVSSLWVDTFKGSFIHGSIKKWQEQYPMLQHFLFYCDVDRSGTEEKAYIDISNTCIEEIKEFAPVLSKIVQSTTKRVNEYVEEYNTAKNEQEAKQKALEDKVREFSKTFMFPVA